MDMGLTWALGYLPSSLGSSSDDLRKSTSTDMTHQSESVWTVRCSKQSVIPYLSKSDDVPTSGDPSLSESLKFEDLSTSPSLSESDWLELWASEGITGIKDTSGQDSRSKRRTLGNAFHACHINVRAPRGYDVRHYRCPENLRPQTCRHLNSSHCCRLRPHSPWQISGSHSTGIGQASSGQSQTCDIMCHQASPRQLHERFGTHSGRSDGGSVVDVGTTGSGTVGASTMGVTVTVDTVRRLFSCEAHTNSQLCGKNLGVGTVYEHHFRTGRGRNLHSKKAPYLLDSRGHGDRLHSRVADQRSIKHDGVLLPGRCLRKAHYRLA